MVQGVVLRQGRVRFHRRVVDGLGVELVLEDVVRRGETGFDVAERLVHPRADVVGVPVVDDRRTFLDRLERVEDGRQFLVLDANQPSGLFGGLLVDSDHAGHLVADITHLRLGQRVLVLGLGHDAVHPVGDVVAGQDALDAGQRESRRGVDVEHDAVRDGRAHHAPPEHPGQGQVVGEQGLPAHLGGGVVHGHAPPDDVHHLHDTPPAVIATVASTAARILT